MRAQIFQTSGCYLQIIGATRVTSMFHTQDPQTSAATAQNLVATVTWCMGFVNPS